MTLVGNDQQPMSVAHVTPSISRVAGGLFESVRHLSRSVQCATRARLAVISVKDAYSEQDRSCWEPVPVRVYPPLGPPAFGYSPGLAADLATTSPDLVHLHGLWRFTSVAVSRWARRAGRPYVVSPHGMLEPWALRHSVVKKRIAKLLYQGLCLQGAFCLRATSELEARGIRLAGYRRPIVIIPNGVELPPEPRTRGNPSSSGRRRALFLSRIHPKKGLLTLVEAWSRLRPPGWELLIVGPNEGGHLLEVQEAVKRSGLGDRIRFHEAAWDEQKWDLFSTSDLFVLPSYSENFGLAIAEALSCGLPVITTWATPWQELKEHACGWWIEVGVEPLTRALVEAFACPVGRLREMGVRGRKLIERRYTWEPMGRKMAAVYEWMLGRTNAPESLLA